MQPATSSVSEAFGAYLNDHLAGAAAGIQLAERIAKGTSDERLEALLGRFVKEFREDSEVLERVMEAHGITKDRAKQAIALAGEWFARLKHVTPVIGSGSQTLVALEDVEVLSLGIEERALLLRSLQQVPSVTALEGVDLPTLEERARRQREELEPFRLGFVSTAASPSAP